MTWQATAADPRERIIVALDVPDRTRALALVRELAPHPGLFKIGLQLFIAEGPSIVAAVRETSARVFLDLKLHDIPNTVSRAVASAGSLGAEMLTVHLSGGHAMIEAAVAAAPPEILLLGVSVLTSVNEEILREIGVHENLPQHALRLAKMGIASGLRGLVSSPRELGLLRANLGSEVKIVTPGIRPAGAQPNDQKRTNTPREALRASADFLVIGRPITAAPDPRAALDRIVADVI